MYRARSLRWDCSAGLGASHQTGTGLVALLLDVSGRLEGKSLLENEGHKATRKLFREQVVGQTVVAK